MGSQVLCSPASLENQLVIFVLVVSGRRPQPALLQPEWFCVAGGGLEGMDLVLLIPPKRLQVRDEI